MKKLYTFILPIFLTVTCSVFAQEQASQQQYDLQLANKGCQKPLGFLPTPAKVMCLLTAFGKSEKEVKPKALAIVFTVCRGYTVQQLPAGTTAKKYANLGTCLKDPTAITLINNELKAKGFPPVKVINTGVLSPAVIKQKI